jgi:hypothetical protein
MLNSSTVPIASIDEIIYLGQAFNPRRKMVTEGLKASVAALFQQLEEQRVDYLLVGGVALLSFIEGRNTQDVDLLIEPAAIGSVAWNGRIVDADFGKASFGGVEVDLLLTTNPLFLDVWRNERTRATFGGREVPTTTREGLLLLKLYALPSLYRQSKLARAALYETDVLMLHQNANVDDEALLRRLKPHLPEHDIDELGKILEEQRSRARFRDH